MSHMTGAPFSRSKGQGHQAALLTAALTRQAAARIERGNLLLRCRLQVRLARQREALRCPQREERGRGIVWWRPPAYSFL